MDYNKMYASKLCLQLHISPQIILGFLLRRYHLISVTHTQPINCISLLFFNETGHCNAFTH